MKLQFRCLLYRLQFLCPAKSIGTTYPPPPRTPITLQKNYELLKTGLNNVVLPTLFNDVNNIEQVVESESSPQSGVTMLNNIVDNIEQCGQHNIVQSCFQQPSTTRDFCRVKFILKFFVFSRTSFKNRN